MPTISPTMYLMACPSLILLMSVGVLARHLIGDAMPNLAAMLSTVTAAANAATATTTETANVNTRGALLNNATDDNARTKANANAERVRAREREDRDRRDREKERERDKDKERDENKPYAPPQGTTPQIPDDLPPVPLPDRGDRAPFIPPYKGKAQADRR